MIELIYNEEEKHTSGEKMLPMPKNTKQIGEPREYKKILMEDYVHTFLHQYGTEAGANAKIAVLFGKAERSGGMRHLYIKSALPVEGVTEKQGKYLFSEKLWGDIYVQGAKYFPEQEIMGWFLAKPGLEAEKTVVTEETHRTYFSGADKVLFMLEPTEGDSGFLGFDGNRFAKQPGFYIYYEKNEPMQMFLSEKNAEQNRGVKKEKPDVAVANFRSILKEKQKKKARRRKLAVSYGMKVCIALVLFAGAVTLKNQTEKIRTMEAQMSQMSETEVTEEVVVQEVISTDVVVENLSAEIEEQKLELPVTESTESVMQEPETQIQSQATEIEKSSEEVVQEEEKQPEAYTVQAGDSLAQISRDKYGTDEMVDEICALNGLANGDYIQVGETILLP